MVLNKNSIFKIIQTNNFFNKCNNNKNNINNNNNIIFILIDDLNIDNSYKYPNDIIIHNIISNIFISRNEIYLEIIFYIIDKFEINKNDINEIKYTLKFILNKILLYNKILNNNSKNIYTELETKIHELLLKLNKKKIISNNSENNQINEYKNETYHQGNENENEYENKNKQSKNKLILELKEKLKEKKLLEKSNEKNSNNSLQSNNNSLQSINTNKFILLNKILKKIEFPKPKSQTLPKHYKFII